MKKHFEWILVAVLIGILMYLGKSQFHQRYLNVFLIVTISLIFLITLGFYWIRNMR